MYFQIRFFIVLLFFTSGFCSAQNSVDVRPNEKGIYYMGRWKNLESNPQCTWQSSSIKAKFKGTSIAAVFSGGRDSQDFRIIIDENKMYSKRITISPDKEKYILAENLSNRTHKIEIVKETYNGKGVTTFWGFTVVGEGVVHWNPTKIQTKILFYGDSNMDGTSLESEKNSGVNGAYYSFVGLTSRMLNAEFQNLSNGGAVIADGRNSGLWFHNRMDRHSEKPDWESHQFIPNIIVINLGANNVGKKTKDEIKSDYKKLLGRIRKTYGHKPYIILMNAYGWSREEPANYTHEVVAEMSDPHLSCFTFPWLFNEWHGCEYDHAGMAQILNDHIVAMVPGIKQIQAIDNLNGFGVNGNVANGSFEEMAHFGGYAWRYSEDGAQRIRDKDQAANGEYFVRLRQGNEIHQPNPAEGGVEYKIRIKMKAVKKGSTGQITIEFRDQDYRNEIPDSGKEFLFQPNDQWEEFMVRVTAPQKQIPSNPSYDVWKILIRLKCKTGTIDIDDVRLSH